jgi:peptidoglycan-associated lipoprotein
MEKRSESMINKFKSAGLAAVAVAALAACATTEEQPVEVVEEVQPVQQEVPTGPAPGSAEDLEQNVGHRVFYGYDQYNLTSEAQATLARQAAWLKEYPEARVRIVGSADERGTREYNLALGARRATSAKAFLVGLGVDASRIGTMSVGKERPIDPRSTPEAWAKNRNATTVLVTTGA